MSEIFYEPVNEPPDPIEAFSREDSAAWQAQAAVLLALAWQLSGEDLAGLDGEVAEYVGIPAERISEPQRVTPATVSDVLSLARPDSERLVRGQLLRAYRNQLDPRLAAALFRVALDSPDALVRAAAATGYLEVGLEPERSLEVLRAEARSLDETVQLVATTTLARVAPELLPPQLGLDLDGPSLGFNSTLLVHGTFARRASWWQPGGDFHTYILNDVAGDLYGGSDAFSWSGNYSDAARLLAATQLVQWIQGHGGGAFDLMTHSHGGSVAMLASRTPLPIRKLVLLSCPVHWRKYNPDFSVINRVISVRVHCDLVILADRGGQRFNDPNIEENVLPLWFSHGATHQPDVWRNEGVPAMVA